ncbi:hypothetical protein AVEN_109532-1 [Araneus ventricosus]|uniref:Uncharacterized protein n=1 Tax=Araneus ventricosus TaxID=182803 RepID=A0A4Y2SM73_ARAVE|nr:hypothetical protein AVEN_109532-1 [Araneus ventricosus]
MIWQVGGPLHDGSSVELGFEPGALRLRGRGLTTRPPRPLGFQRRIEFCGVDFMLEIHVGGLPIMEISHYKTHCSPSEGPCNRL